MSNATLDLVAEDVGDVDWEDVVRYLAGDDLDTLDEQDIQGCCGGCLSCCDNCGAGWCIGLCW